MFTSKIALVGSLALQNHQARCSPFGCAAKGTARAKHAEAAFQHNMHTTYIAYSSLSSAKHVFN